MDNFPGEPSFILADTHVHIYNCYDLRQLLDSALGNFKKTSKEQGIKQYTAFLFLTETIRENWFHRLTELATNEKGPGPGSIGKWTFRLTKEDCSLYAGLNAEGGLYLIAGRQIKTAENMEVLALGTIQSLEEGSSLEELTRLINKYGAITVIPWGLGKWTGRRGTILKKLLDKKGAPYFFLGDNRNRPVFWPRPTPFKQEERRRRAVLPGSDSLPFPSEVRYVGSYGFTIEGSIDPEYPARDIKKLLVDPTTILRAYGSRENPVRFFWNQLRFNGMKRKESYSQHHN